MLFIGFVILGIVFFLALLIFADLITDFIWEIMGGSNGNNSK